MRTSWAVCLTRAWRTKPPSICIPLACMIIKVLVIRTKIQNIEYEEGFYACQGFFGEILNPKLNRIIPHDCLGHSFIVPLLYGFISFAHFFELASVSLAKASILPFFVFLHRAFPQDLPPDPAADRRRVGSEPHFGLSLLAHP